MEPKCGDLEVKPSDECSLWSLSSLLGTTCTTEHGAIKVDFVMALVLRFELISELVQIHRLRAACIQTLIINMGRNSMFRIWIRDRIAISARGISFWTMRLQHDADDGERLSDKA